MRAVDPFYLKENKTKTSKVREQHHSTFHKKIVKTSFITTIINITNLGLEIDICSSTQQSFNHLFVAIQRSLHEGSVSILFERKQNQNIKSQSNNIIPHITKRFFRAGLITTIINITNTVLKINIYSCRQRSFNSLFVTLQRSQEEDIWIPWILFERKQNQNISQRTISLPYPHKSKKLIKKKQTFFDITG